MCGFKPFKQCLNGLYVHISIQLLCGFKLASADGVDEQMIFQYNFCVGSSVKLHLRDCFGQYFNTTFVWVQEFWRRGDLMFYANFNTTFVWVQGKTDSDADELAKFQYNFCVGSRRLKSFFSIFYRLFQYNFCVGSSVCWDIIVSNALHFNTTFVWVQDILYVKEYMMNKNFNTTFVWVQVRKLGTF